MTFHQLRIFSTVAKNLNISEAAIDLHISQPSVSEQLKLLEQEYRVKLYKSTGRGIQLTEDGRVFLKNTEPILSLVETLKNKFRNKPMDRKVGSVTVGGSHNPSTSLLPLLLAVFKETHPHVHLTFRTDTSQAIERMVLGSEVEIAVITNCSHHPSMVVQPYQQDNFVAVVSPKHPLAKNRALTMAELARAPLVIKKGREGTGRIWEVLRNLEGQGSKLNIVLYCESPEAAKSAVRAGIGVGILHKEIVAPDARRGDVKIIPVKDLKMQVQTFIIYHKERPLSRYAQDFLVLLREWRRRKHGAKNRLRAAQRFASAKKDSAQL
jgi:DNA-binding transcriptional LysR family regulator